MKIASAATVQEWRHTARQLLAEEISPAEVLWRDSTPAELVLDLGSASPAKTDDQSFRVPKAFLTILEHVCRHSNPQKWARLYEMLWRLTHGEKHLLSISSDPLVRALTAMQREVKRDAYKLTTFVRFREVQHEGESWFIAWYEPEHDVVELAFPWFRDRFTNMRFSILTPRKSAHWDMEKGWFTPGIAKQSLPEDDFEKLWVTYYCSTFNPARLKVKAMQAQMPKKYWKNLPEAAAITGLIQSSGGRTEEMISRAAAGKPGSGTLHPEK